MVEFINALGEAFYIFLTALLHIFKDRPKIRHFVDRLIYIGADTLPVVVITSMFTGGVLALQTYSTLHKFNSEYSLGHS
jgi:ABC-type transport system involved in resistance to organic solvents, permease component